MMSSFCDVSLAYFPNFGISTHCHLHAICRTPQIAVDGLEAATANRGIERCASSSAGIPT